MTTTFLCDVDNPGHAEWTEEAVAEAMREYETLPVLATAGVYHTAHGRRIVQPLETPIPAGSVEAYLRRWLFSLEDAGIVVDWACRDWTRHFRLPHVRRNRRAFRSPLVLLDRMHPIALEPIVSLSPDPAAPARRSPRIAMPLPWRDDLPEHWQSRARTIAKAVRDSVTANWHAMYLALGGSLLARGCPPERLPALIYGIASEAISEKPASHRKSAEDTARRYAAGLPATGHRTLAEAWPAVARAVEQVTSSRADTLLRPGPVVEARPLEEAVRELTNTIRKAPDGLTVVSAECGIGKTQAAIVVAAERAAKGYATPTAQGLRAPCQSKTAISVDKNKLAEQIANELTARGTPVRRIFGPLSVLREDGTPECRFYDNARPLVDGGQPMHWELCEGGGIERCEHYATCKAKDGVEGPSDARVIVGSHALIAELDAAAGSSGLLVVDEPPAVLETVTISTKDLATTRAAIGWFEGAFALAMAPVLDAFAQWLEIADAGAPCEPMVALRAVAGASTEDLVAGAARSLPEDRHSTAPPIRRSYMFMARRSVAQATHLGTASKVLGTLYDAVTSQQPASVRVEERGTDTALMFTRARTDFAGALRRQGSVVVTDANADLHLPIFTKIVGYAPRFHKFTAADGAPIARSLIRCGTANRRGWLAFGRLILDAGAVAAVRLALQWAEEDPTCRTLGIITIQHLRALLEAALRQDDASAEAECRRLRISKRLLAEARDKLGPLLQAWPGEVCLGHYGAMRGLNSMANVDALITLGDPWPNLGDVRNDVAFLALGSNWEERVEALCRAELEQAHGRLRAVHRKRAARALHVGTVLPGGHGWASAPVDVRLPKPGPARTPPALALDAVVQAVRALGGVRATARALGCSPAAVTRYCSGQRAVPAPVAVALVQAATPT